MRPLANLDRLGLVDDQLVSLHLGPPFVMITIIYIAYDRFVDCRSYDTIKCS
jgi:hypothetical protein